MLATNSGSVAAGDPRLGIFATGIPATPPSLDEPHRRDLAIDGWRAIAAGCVVLSHALNFRFPVMPGYAMHLIQRLSGPLAQLGVQLFFVISGFIITSLMLREQRMHGRVGIGAFYVRRLCRILPPLIAYLAVVLALSAAGALSLSDRSLAASATFTCNTGLVECEWWVAHTWSLAVEEQFYLGWPLLFAALAPMLRWWLLAIGLAGCTIGIAVDPLVFQSNFTSFGCIAAGALYAVSPGLRQMCGRTTSTPAWLAAASLLVVGPLVGLGIFVIVLLPFLVAYVIFAGKALRWVCAILETRALQIIGAGSYSLYLWQQLFLAPPARYLVAPFSLALLPVIVVLSVRWIERPFIRLGRRLSRHVEPAPAA